MMRDQVKAEALRHIAAFLRDSPTEGPLWEGAWGSGLDSFTPDDAGRRAALQFTTALEEIAGELEGQADAISARLRAAGERRQERERYRAERESEARIAAEVAAWRREVGME